MTAISVCWSIFSSTGNMVDSFDSESDAREALREIVRNEPEAADECAILAFDSDGIAVSSIFGTDL